MPAQGWQESARQPVGVALDWRRRFIVKGDVSVIREIRAVIEALVRRASLPPDSVGWMVRIGSPYTLPVRKR